MLPRLTADSTPIGTPSNVARPAAISVSWMVSGARSISACVTLRLRKIESPSRSAATERRKSRYCSGNGASSPSRARSAATSPAVASDPSITAAGSPGMMCEIRKTMVVTMNMTTTIPAMRRRTYSVMSLRSGVPRGFAWPSVVTADAMRDSRATDREGKMGEQATFRRRALLAGGAAALLPWGRAAAQSAAPRARSRLRPSAIRARSIRCRSPRIWCPRSISISTRRCTSSIPACISFPCWPAALPEISADGKQYTIKLRTDARFHDGSTMDGGRRGDLAATLDTAVAARPLDRRLCRQHRRQQPEQRGDDAEAAVCADAGAARLSQWRRGDHAEAAGDGAGSAEGIRRHRAVQADRI